MIKLGRVSKETRGTPVIENMVEDLVLLNDGRYFPKPQ